MSSSPGPLNYTATPQPVCPSTSIDRYTNPYYYREVYGPTRLRLSLLLALLAAPCAPGRTPSAAVDLPAPPPGLATPIVSGGDQLIPLPDGPSAFAAIADVLRTARRSIDLELYEFQRLDLADMLLDAHDRGGTVTAIKDPSERSSTSTWAKLEQGGDRVVAFQLAHLRFEHYSLLYLYRSRC